MAPNKRHRHGKEPMDQAGEEPQDVSWKHQELATRELFDRVKIHPTRFNERLLLRSMGLLEGVDELLENMGMRCLKDMYYPTYPEATKDFLSTVELEYKDPKDKKASEGLLTFKIGSKGYRLTMGDICEAFNFKNGEAVEFGSFGGATHLWRIIANGNYQSARAKMTGIRNPVIRYVCKLLANTFFARRDAGAVTMTELSLIYQGLKHKLTDRRGVVLRFEFGDEINYGCIFAEKLLSFKKWVIKTPKPDLYVGAMISPLLVKAGVDVTKYEHLPMLGYLHRDYLRESWFLKRQKNLNKFHCRIELRNQDERILVLPHPETHVRTLDNIKFELPEDQFLPLEERVVLEEPEREAPRGSEAMLQELNEIEMPDIDFKPRTKREEFIQIAYKAQRKINELQKKLIGKLFKKVKKLQPPNYVSSEEEDEEMQEEAENE